MSFIKNFFKVFLIIFTCLASSIHSQEIVAGKVNYDVKIYKILLRELKAAERLQESEPNTANLFRVFTTRIEILKFLRTKNVEDALKKPNSTQVRDEARQIEKFYNKTKILASTIDKDKSFKERPKFLLLNGLLLYEFEEKNKTVPNYLGNAFAMVKEQELKHLAASKLGDYYFNLPDFKESAKYYREAIKLEPKSEWRTRHYYNLGWCFFKMENFETAIKLMMTIFNEAKTPEEKKDYYYQQSTQKIPFFYLYANNPDEGYLFVKKHSGLEGQEIIGFIKEVYNKGFFDKINSLVIDVENTLESRKKYKALLDFQLEIYFHIASREFKKNYSMMSRLRKGIASGDGRKLLVPEKKKQFIEDNKNLLNQYLGQINRKTFDPAKNVDDKLTLDDSVDILRLLLSMDESNSVSYRLKLAQLYNKTGQRDQAMKMLWEDYIKYGGVDNPEAGPYLAELLVVLDAMGNKAPTENVEKIYQDYLKVGKDQNIKKVVYLKYFDFFFNRSDYKGSLSLIKRHQKEFPEEKEDRKNMLVKILNQSLKQKDKLLFDSIRDHAKKDIAINTNAQIMKSINTGHNTFLLEKVNKSLNDQGVDKSVAAGKLAEIFRSNSIDRTNQLISGFNAGLIFVGLGNLSSSEQIYGEFIEQLSPAEYKDYHDKITTIADNQLLAGQEEYSLQLYLKLISTGCKINKVLEPNDVQKAFELSLIRQKENITIELLNSADRCQWSADLRKKIYAIIIEYMPLSDAVIGRKFLKYLTLQKVNKKDEIEKVLESVFIHLVNKKRELNLSIANTIVDFIESQWITPNSYSSEFTKELRELINRNSRLKNYLKERINVNNFAKFVTANFELFTSNIDIFTSYRPKYASVFQIKSMLEIKVIKDFILSFNNIENLIDDEKNKILYIEQIKEALKPLEERVNSENSRLFSYIQTESTLLKHKSIQSNDILYPEDTDTFILDRL